jgi:hypothetical protein
MAVLLTYLRGAAAAIAVASSISMSTGAASAQGVGGQNFKYSGPPVDNRPKVDEKAYKGALERIPDSKEKYDPWGGARAPDSGKPKSK